MAVSKVGKQIDRLQSTLLTTGLQTRDNPTYQVLNQLIGITRDIQAEFDALVIPTAPVNPGGGSSVTSNFAASLIGDDRGNDNPSASILFGSNSSLTGIPGGLTGYVQFNGGGYFAGDSDFTFSVDTLTITKVVAPTSVSTPSLISTGALTITPAAGSNLNIALSTTGDFAVNTNQLYVDTSTARVGISTSTPGAGLDVNTTAFFRNTTQFLQISPEIVSTIADGYIVTEYASGTGGGGQNVFRRADGTQASPSVVLNGMGLGSFSFRGWASAGGFTGSKGRIGVTATEDWSATANGTQIVFQTTANTTTTLTDRMYIDNTGNVGIGSLATPAAYLHINKAGTATAGTAPFRLTSGTNLTTAVAGAFEYNGTNLFFTPASTRLTVWCGNDGASAPTTNLIGVIVDYYGSSATRVLTTPNSWGSVVIAGTTYKIPLYT